MITKPLRYISAGVLFFTLAGCASINAGYRAADDIASNSRFQKEYVKTNLCSLTTFHNFTRSGAPLTIYIEGDGFAWRTRHELSSDPTPRHPLVLSLAAIDPSENVAYIARPGQLTASSQPDCDPAYWSEKRFSEEVVSAINSVIDHLKEKSGAKEISLIGYSGGAAIAVLVAARRSDIASLRTIAGNLDNAALTRYQGVSPLSGSLNPIDVAEKIKYLPQRHFVGSDDKVVPLFIAQSFVRREGDKDFSRITIVNGATHAKGWQERWKELLSGR